MNEIQLQSLPLSLKDNKNENHIDFSKINCSVAVHYCIYDKKKKTIINIGTSRPCGENYNRSSVHAEELAVQYIKNLTKINRYEIYIYRYSKGGLLKPVFCCQRCSKFINRNNLQNKIFTFDQSLNIYSAMGSSYISLGYRIKHNKSI